MAEGGGDDGSLRYRPTWVVAVVCSVIVLISFGAERILHFTGNYLKKKNQKPLYEALLKIKEELMLLGFISLLLVAFEGKITKICVNPSLTQHLLPCEIPEKNVPPHHKTPSHYQISSAHGRHLLASSTDSEYCSQKEKVSLLPLKALHQLHIFIFVLAIVHVSFCALTIFLGGLKIRQWKHWEDYIAKEKYDTQKVLNKVTDVHEHDFIKDHFRGIGKISALLGWLQSFFKQFYGSVTKSDYITLRLGFIMTHCKENPKFNFHKYMIRTLEADFKKVVGISWYLWILVVIFLLLNINGWNTYFWISFIPFFLLLAVGTKLEHVINQLAYEVAEKHIAVEGDLVVKPSDDHFWFHRPGIVIFLIHFILFQNAFEMALFFWIWIEFGFTSCIMGKVPYIVPRLVIGVFVQVLCSYSTLPLFAIVTQMGSSFKRTIFEEHLQAGLVGWAQKARKKREGLITGIRFGKKSKKQSVTGEGNGEQKESTPVANEPPTTEP